MEKSLSNELFVVGVSLDCLAVGCPENSPIANRLQALSGQVLSDSQKVNELENLDLKRIQLLRDIISLYNEWKDDERDTPVLDRLWSVIESIDVV